MAITGIQSGMVLQRDRRGMCEALLHSAAPLRRASYSGAGEGDAELQPLGDGRYRLRGIPVGGPYTVTIEDRRYTDIYVGDVWLLAGQSNMAGVGHTTRADCRFLGDPEVRAFYMTDQWDAANHPLHATGWAVDQVHTRVIGSGYPNYEACIGPGLSFARKMKEWEGVPQGIICCAHSGTSLSQWSPELRHLGGDGSLYGAMLRRFQVCGSHVRGLFWYQGCNETTREDHGEFTKRMVAFAEACRRDFGTDLPIVQVQIGRVTNRTIPEQEAYWDSVQEQQRLLDRRIPGLYTLSAVSKGLDDAIHLSSESQEKLGAEAAEAMVCLLHGDGERNCLPPPALESVTLEPGPFNRWAVVRVRYKNLHGGLTALGRPAGFTILEREGREPTQYVHDIRLQGPEALLYADRLPEELLGGRLFYGRGCNPYCNITDEAGRAIPVMGPILLDHVTETAVMEEES